MQSTVWSLLHGHTMRLDCAVHERLQTTGDVLQCRGVVPDVVEVDAVVEHRLAIDADTQQIEFCPQNVRRDLLAVLPPLERKLSFE
ncbi:hypothetical protein [Wenzhouxiangella sp. XN24]|uniref:hypothetical protein n=1 Tax=Wenzhouxiangella sp. XN24 TaxID=2713569 RepID=UPI0013EB82EC|nr:hypothetical protein [Wenzhouxiangella sp. XN24]NGX17104.1 hypothetical protein [Wenzhouxiangella sp. XN24]